MGDDFTLSDDPFGLFGAWFAEASASEINDPNAMALATVDAQGLPNVRMVLLKGHDARGFVFYTNTQSQKGRELAHGGKAAVVFHWKSLQRQVRIRGPVLQVSDGEADEYYRSRGRVSRLGAWASQQSRPLPDRETLEAAVARYDALHPGDAIPRPPHWTGFRISPDYFEFWHDRPSRLHDRIIFTRTDSSQSYTKERWYP